MLKISELLGPQKPRTKYRPTEITKTLGSLGFLALGRQRQEDLWGLLACQPSCIYKLQVHGALLSQKNKVQSD